MEMGKGHIKVKSLAPGPAQGRARWCPEEDGEAPVPTDCISQSFLQPWLCLQSPDRGQVSNHCSSSNPEKIHTLQQGVSHFYLRQILEHPQEAGAGKPYHTAGPTLRKHHKAPQAVQTLKGPPQPHKGTGSNQRHRSPHTHTKRPASGSLWLPDLCSSLQLLQKLPSLQAVCSRTWVRRPWLMAKAGT